MRKMRKKFIFVISHLNQVPTFYFDPLFWEGRQSCYAFFFQPLSINYEYKKNKINKKEITIKKLFEKKKKTKNCEDDNARDHYT